MLSWAQHWAQQQRRPFVYIITSRGAAVVTLRVIYAGTPDFAVPALQCLHQSEHQVVAVFTQPDRPSGRGRKLIPSAVKKYALDQNLPIEQPLDFSQAAAVELVQQYQPDVMVVAAYGVLLPATVLNIPSFGCLNIHASLLPRWRGAAPLQRAILAGDKLSGASIMLMEEGLDTGPVLQSVDVSIEPTTTTAELHDEVAEAGAKALMDVLPRWCRGEVTPQVQQEAESNYARKLQKSEAVIDWSSSAQSVQRSVMAFNPWPVAQTQLGDRVLRIWRSAPVDEATIEAGSLSGEPGTVFQPTADRMLVRCGDSWLELLQVQLPGKKAMPVSEFLKANPVNGVVLGDTAAPEAARTSS